MSIICRRLPILVVCTMCAWTLFACADGSNPAKGPDIHDLAPDSDTSDLGDVPNLDVPDPDLPPDQDAVTDTPPTEVTSETTDTSTTQEIVVCVLIDQDPNADCEPEPLLSFGTIAAFARVEKRVKFTLAGNRNLTLSDLTVTPADSRLTNTVKTLTWVQDDWQSQPITLPYVINAGNTFYVDLVVAADERTGPLTANELRLRFTGGQVDLVTLPISGTFSGCPEGLGDCDGDSTNGCETQLLDNLEHCGACDHHCALPNANARCENGRCLIDACHAGFADCDNNPSNGCEINLLDDKSNCGTCRVPCSLNNAIEACVDGVCQIVQCTAGFDDCDNDPTNGCEAALASTSAHCGACGVSCVRPNAQVACVSSACVISSCTHPWANCDNDPANGCEVNLNVSLGNCGACNKTCAPANAAPICYLGTCYIEECLPGWLDCDNDHLTGCEAQENSLAHCGGCYSVCDLANASETCDAGVCNLGACNAGYANCDGVPQNGCEIHVAADIANCGTCGNRCEDHIPNANVACNGTCSFVSCKTGFWDLNQNAHQVPSDGCEYACTFVSASDLPDDTFTDQNCDGIDGTVTQAIFVSPNGSDAWPGTMAQPKRNLPNAIDAAAAAGKNIYLAAGTYNLTTPLALKNGVSIYGGYNASTWARSAVDVPLIVASSSTAFTATDITANTVLDRISIRAGNAIAPGTSSYGLFATNSPGLVIRHSRIEAGNGAPGQNGNTPIGSAAAGGNGNAGTPGCEDSNLTCRSCSAPIGALAGTNTSCSSGTAGGRGGNAGHGSSSGSNGVASAAGTAGGTGTPARRGDWNPDFVHRGTNGAAGTVGQNGSAGAETYTTSGYNPTNGTNGTAGANGRGGGGGGGGGGGDYLCNSYGGSGAGGGAGGCGGAAATGGTSAGGSFAIFLQNANITIQNTILVTGNGGNGGYGGTGQTGGNGGQGGWGGNTSKPNAGNAYGGADSQDDASNGGRGGNGGAGGRGGHGGGGAGGPSVGILRRSSNPTLSNNTFILGTAGTGGTSPGAPGPNGTRAETLVN